MRLIFLAAAFTSSYGYTGNYIKLIFFVNDSGAVVTNITTADADACTGKAVASNILIRPMDVLTHADDVKSYVGDMQGACVNYDRTGDTLFTMSPIKTFQTTWDNAATQSFALFKTANAGEYKVQVSTGAACTNLADATTAVTGFMGLTSAPDCGGRITGAPANVMMTGLDLSYTAPAGVGAQATLFAGKKMLAMDIVGPYLATGCTQLAGGAARDHGALPIVLPLEDATAPGSNAPLDEVGLTTSNYTVQDFSANQQTANNLFMVKSNLTATKGELVITSTWGTDAAFSSRNNITPGSVTAQNFVATFAIGLRGGFTATCVRAKEADGSDATAWYKLIPSMDSIGSFPNAVDVPTSAPTECSPATALHISATMTFLFALIAMIM